MRSVSLLQLQHCKQKINVACSLSPLTVWLLIDEAFVSWKVPVWNPLHCFFYREPQRKCAGVPLRHQTWRGRCSSRANAPRVEFLLAADGAGNEKLMGKITSSMFTLSIKAKKEKSLDWESKRSSLHKEAADFLVAADGWRRCKKWFPAFSSPSGRHRTDRKLHNKTLSLMGNAV